MYGEYSVIRKENGAGNGIGYRDHFKATEN